MEIIKKHELREIDMGECENGWDEIRDKFPEFVEAFLKHEIDVPYPNGECGKDVWERSIKVIKYTVNDE